MGLDTTHNCYHGSYTYFNRFRYALARQIGINLDDYIGYSDKGTKDLDSIEHDIMPLLNHSDCDGRLKITESRRIAKGLNLILENFNPKLKHPERFKDDIIQFRDGCLDAVSKREMIHFY